MATKNNPGKYDCYENAKPDEPMFVLLARDPCAAFAVAFWAELRTAAGLNAADDLQIKESGDCAVSMAEYCRGISKEKKEAIYKVLAVERTTLLNCLLD